MKVLGIEPATSCLEFRREHSAITHTFMKNDVPDIMLLIPECFTENFLSNGLILVHNQVQEYTSEISFHNLQRIKNTINVYMRIKMLM